MCGWQVKLCDPLVTYGPNLSALAVVLPIIRCYTNIQITLTLTLPVFTVRCSRMSETSLHKSITRVLSFSDTEPTGYPKNSTFLTSDMYTRYKMLQQFNNSVIICHSRDFECCWRSVVTFLCVNCS